MARIKYFDKAGNPQHLICQNAQARQRAAEFIKNGETPVIVTYVPGKKKNKH